MLVGGGVAFAHFASGKVLSKQVRQPKEVLCIQSLLIMWNVGNVREGVNNLGTSVCVRATAIRAGIHLMAHILFDYNDTYVANIMFRYIDMLYICVSECVYMCAHVCAFFPIKLS